MKLTAVGLQHLSEEVATANSFIKYLTSCMKPDVKENIDMMVTKRALGLNKQNGGAGILFANHLVNMQLVLDNKTKTDVNELQKINTPEDTRGCK